MARRKHHVDERNIASRRLRDEQESEPGCSRKKMFRSNRKSNNTESDKATEEAELSDSNINSQSDLSVLDNVSKQSMKRSMNETNNNKETTVFDLHESETKTDGNVILEFDKENQDPENHEEMKENPEKKIKTENNKAIYKLRSQSKKPHVTIERCKHCQQKLNDLKLYQGHPNGALEEQIALIDPKLCLFMGDESFIDEIDARPQNKLTHFSVYDMNGHLCPFDTGLIEKNVLLYFSGYMKPIYEENSLPEGGIPTMDMGPINEWFVTGFDGGELALIGFSTAFAEYILMEPSETYTEFMDAVKEKIYMSKLVTEFLLDEINLSYEDLLNKLHTVVPPKETMKFTEDTLLCHSQFICDQIMSLDKCAEPEDTLLITAPCIRSLMKLSGVTLGKKKSAVRPIKRARKVKEPAWSMATTTKLVNDVFESIFPDQLAKLDTNKLLPNNRRRRCGVCEICQQPECGTCVACKDMPKFGGKRIQKQACIRRRCPNLAIQEADDSDPENEEQYESSAEEDQTIQKQESKMEDFKELKQKKDIIWEEENKVVDGSRTYYKSVIVGNERIQLNDYVLLEPRNPKIPIHICKIVYMWENEYKEKLFHANRFRKGTDTILGETADTTEIFLSDQCVQASFMSVKSKVTVIYKKAPENWSELGNIEIKNDIKDADGKTFFYRLKYDYESARFEDPPPDLDCPFPESHRYCPSCTQLAIATQRIIPRVYNQIEEKSRKEVIYELVKYKGEEYKVGSAVFLFPHAVTFEYKRKFEKSKNPKTKLVDEDMYPEFYRKKQDHNIKNSEPEPFHIGYINKIYATSTDILVAPQDIFIKINKMYRPENTHRDLALMEQSDINMVYWSHEICTVNFSMVAGKCYLTYFKNMSESIEEWSMGGPNRFYFTEAYNPKEKTFDEPPPDIINTGKFGKGKGKGKSLAKKEERIEKKQVFETPIDHPIIPRRLRTLDMFAGCGGLSEGLHQAGVAESLWAIEKEIVSANAYRLNNPKTTVFTDDCNKLLERVINGEHVDDKGQKLPQKGDIELLCGGPPCQGFSGMNRFNRRQYSLFKNSLVVTALAYCDYYRPKFFVMENVRNFVAFKQSMVLKLTLKCLIRMGYQCAVGILQAGSYGIPQTRRRMILIAAAPGEILPQFPAPTHVFTVKGGLLSRNMKVDNESYRICSWEDQPIWKEFAPYRIITVKDALYDLPEIKCGSNKEEISYGGEPITHFQRKMRGKPYQQILIDHICKEMNPVTEARISYIPTTGDSDWRDLPNIVVRLRDGTFTKKLEYLYDDPRVGRSSTNAFRGVCCCCNGKSCDPTIKQSNTLIPWCLPHTSTRHNNWSGLYGRLDWNGIFKTTITNPEPMGKQGRVLHPVQNRVVSVRECARSQGFPDSYRFFGTINNKYRQIGNAVPPPLAAAIGHEIRKCIRDTTLYTKPKPMNNYNAKPTTSKSFDNSFNESLDKSHNDNLDKNEHLPDAPIAHDNMNNNFNNNETVN